MRNKWESWEARQVVERYVAMREGAAVGVAVQRHEAWARMPERFCRVSAELLPALRTAARLDGLYSFVEELARADGGLTFIAWCWEHDSLLVDCLVRRGYREERRERFWELDLMAERSRLEAMAAASRARMREHGIEVTTLDRVDEPEKYRRLWRMSEEGRQDAPRSAVPFVPFPFDTFMRWLRSPGVREDRIWVAGEGGALVGVAMLAYPPTRGVVYTKRTGTARKVRGHGVARALKCETLLQAIALGVPRVRTDNDFRNAPILHLNESMGYRRRPDMIEVHKRT